MPARTHRYALELYGVGDEVSGGHHGIYLPRENLTDTNTSGQLSYAEGSGIITSSPLKLYVTQNIPAALEVNSNVSAASQSVVRITQDHTTGGQVCLELNQDDVSVAPLKITDSTGSAVIDNPESGTVAADHAMAINIGTSTYMIPLMPDF